MNKIVVILGAQQRRWQHVLVERLETAGYHVGVHRYEQALRRPAPPERILRFEARRFGETLASPVPPRQDQPLAGAHLLVDLTGDYGAGDTPVLRLRFNGADDFPGGLARIVANRSLPVLTTHLNGEIVGVARPMLSCRLWLSRISDEVLAGALSLVEQSIRRYFAGSLHPLEAPPAEPTPLGFWRHYLPGLAGNLVGRARQKLATKRPFYWQVAYRQSSGALANPAHASPAELTVLPDDGERFYADPFVLEHEGRTFLFVEEYPYSKAKGIISVAELGRDGRFGVPRPVLEEPYHLSYPQVFKHGEDIYMLPESGGASRLVLYRAASFPHHWVVDTVLLSDIDINDATVLQRDGLYWLVGTQRRGVGSASDTMVVFHADALQGPWTPHKLNPIAIDRSAARPGGAFFNQDDRTFLPVQDGARVYGGGLGLMELLRLDTEAVDFAPPVPVDAGPAWNHRGIHTLNRLGALEVLDSAG